MDRIKSRNRKVSSLFLIATPSGTALTQSTLRIRFDNARNIVEKRALELGDANLALKFARFNSEISALKQPLKYHLNTPVNCSDILTKRSPQKFTDGWVKW